MPRKSEAVLDIEQPAATPMTNASIIITEYLMVSSCGWTHAHSCVNLGYIYPKTQTAICSRLLTIENSSAGSFTLACSNRRSFMKGNYLKGLSLRQDF
jgi:hypothetical protein